MLTLNCKGKLIVLDQPLIMGVVNITQDSFYPGSRFQNQDAIAAEVEKMRKAGAAIIDIGGQSTRPGSERHSADQEMQRTLPIVEMLSNRYPDLLVSIDTYHASVATAAVAAGAAIINDISAGEMDPDMLQTVAALGVPYVCMHMRGVPETMHLDTHYDGIVTEVLDFFIRKIQECRLAGIKDVIVDPGFGFGKGIGDNFSLLKGLPVLQMLSKPILVGLSRKSTVYKTLQTAPDNALNGTTVLNTIALQNGAMLLRVHDVREAREAVILYEAYAATKTPVL